MNIWEFIEKHPIICFCLAVFLLDETFISVNNLIYAWRYKK